MTGKWPPKLVDHENTIRHDNSWDNLRKAAVNQNLWNRGPSKLNKSGYKNICWAAKDKAFKVQVMKNYKCVYYKNFKTLREAIAARDIALTKYHGAFARAA
jgi:hypothetical protein